MKTKEIKRLLELIRSVEAGEQIPTKDLALCKLALVRELEIQQARSDRTHRFFQLRKLSG